jgi:hypothetical protein
MQKPGKNDNISENKDEKKQSDQPRDVTNEETDQGDDALDPGTPFPDPVVKPS